MRHATKLALTLLLAALACAMNARAQSAPTTLTGGFVTTGEFLSDFRGGAGILLGSSGRGGGGTTRDFKISFLMSDTPRQSGLSRPCLAGFPPCAPGATIPTSGRYAIRATVGNSPAIIGGTRYRSVFVLGDLDFTGASVTVPDSQEPLVVVHTPVVMTGSLTVTPAGGPAVIFSSPVTARGYAVVLLQKVTGGFQYKRITYVFAGPATAPTLSVRGWIEGTAERVGKMLGRDAAKAK